MTVNWDSTPWNAPPGELSSDHEYNREDESSEDEEDYGRGVIYIIPHD